MMLMCVHVLQLHEYDAVLEVEITEWTSAGLVSRVEVKVVLSYVKSVFPWIVLFVYAFNFVESIGND